MVKWLVNKKKDSRDKSLAYYMDIFYYKSSFVLDFRNEFEWLQFLDYNETHEFGYYV